MGAASGRGQRPDTTPLKEPPRPRGRSRFRRCLPCAVADVVRALRPVGGHATPAYPFPPLATPSSTYLAAASHAQTPVKGQRGRSRSDWTDSTATGGSSRRPSRDRGASDDLEEQLRRRRVRVFVKPIGEQVVAVTVDLLDEVQELLAQLQCPGAQLVFGTQLLAEGTTWGQYAITAGVVVELWPRPLRRDAKESEGRATVPRVPLAHLVKKEDRSWYDREAEALSVSSIASDSCSDSGSDMSVLEPLSIAPSSVAPTPASSFAPTSVPASLTGGSPSFGGSPP